MLELVPAGMSTRGSMAPRPRYAEQLRSEDLSVGRYVIPVGARDLQEPHTEDEVYVVHSGRARLVTPDGAVEVAAGSVVFVPAGEDHRFEDITEELVVTVVFGPAEGTRATGE
ncbi:MAG TPA: cupin domain-containing protein [Nocardioidaceae bacterium]|jgi:mannose-6-phosphate isomerase-like protein (cupin superfamily)|nr:cupin domain-containing protein [Nocardioidaceae bacterium]